MVNASDERDVAAGENPAIVPGTFIDTLQFGKAEESPLFIVILNMIPPGLLVPPEKIPEKVAGNVTPLIVIAMGPLRMPLAS